MLSVRNVQIEAIATAMPKESYAVEDYVADYLSEKRIKRIIKETGFSRLHIAPQDKSTADYCIAAAKRLFKEFPKENIGGIVFVTQTPNFVNPATSYFIQGELSLSHDTICLDINQGCSGYVYGIYVASLLARNTQKSILLLAGETSSKYIAPDDMSMRVIMGDAGSATIVSPGGANVFNISLKAYGELANVLYTPNSIYKHSDFSGTTYYTRMNGGKLMEFALDDVSEDIKVFMGEENKKPNEYTLCAFHQPNRQILHAVSQLINVDKEKLPFTAGEIGNTSVTSIPLVLTACKEKDLSNVFMCGFGVGLSSSMMSADLSWTKIYHTVEL